MKAQRLTKLQQEYIDKDFPVGSYVAFNFDIFKSDDYKDWKMERRAKLRNAPASTNKQRAK